VGTRTRRTDSIRTPAPTLRTPAARVRAHRPLPATALRARTLPAPRQARRRPPPTSTAISIRSSRRPSKKQPALRAPTTRPSSRGYRRQRRMTASVVNDPTELDPSPLAADDGSRSAAAGPVLSSSTSSDTSNQTLPCRFECSITVSRCPSPYGRLIGQMFRWTYQFGRRWLARVVSSSRPPPPSCRLVSSAALLLSTLLRWPGLSEPSGPIRIQPMEAFSSSSGLISDSTGLPPPEQVEQIGKMRFCLRFSCDFPLICL
jgi:hypothetical protein